MRRFVVCISVSLVVAAGGFAFTASDLEEPCRSWLASEAFEYTTFIQLKRVIVDDLRWQASSYI
jgi:hypothetical protein